MTANRIPPPPRASLPKVPVLTGFYILYQLLNWVLLCSVIIMSSQAYCSDQSNVFIPHGRLQISLMMSYLELCDKAFIYAHGSLACGAFTNYMKSSKVSTAKVSERDERLSSQSFEHFKFSAFLNWSKIALILTLSIQNQDVLHPEIQNYTVCVLFLVDVFEIIRIKI